MTPDEFRKHVGRSAAAAALVLGCLAPLAAEARPYTVDKAASRLGFRGQMEGAAFQGTFSRWDAQIDFDARNLKTSRAVVTIETASARTGDAGRDEALPSSDWFAVGKFPRATFVTRSITAKGPGRYEAAGDLTIRGVKRAVVLPFTLSETGGVARMRGSLVIDRRWFGVGQGQFRNDGMVAANVTIDVSVVARPR
jgi:polyisoprenoid-binding protein YceI